MSTSPRPRPAEPRLPDAPPSEAAWKVDAVTAIVHGSLERLLDVVPEVDDPLGAELLGSDVAGIWWAPGAERDQGMRASEALVARSYAAHLEQLGDDRALAALRCLQAGAGGGWTDELAGAATRLADRGRREPPWWTAARERRPAHGGELRWTVHGRELTLLLLQIADPYGGVTLVPIVDGGADGVIADILLVTELDGLIDYLAGHGQVGPSITWTSPARAAERTREAIARTDLIGVAAPPPGSEREIGYVGLRGVLQRWTEAALAG
ncbi:hypothetical protein [Patulibacter sp. SYSU D01012]|uniref:hypothetical protein n=1 Tax=Patulibacter sp. SYSU D01012 TaxID=2817381 RepID=UPI001B30D56B|nr:hypothetical protein [Patulibacter sp. SYSU D01012]